MIIPPRYRLTPRITRLIQQIEHLKTKFDLLPQHQLLEKYTRQRSILKSAVYSARIEGNPKRLNEVSLSTIRLSQEKHNLELANLYRSLKFITLHPWVSQLTISDTIQLHGLVLKNLSLEAGHLRQEPSAIYNRAGVAIYICPPPQEIRSLLRHWLQFVNRATEPIIPIKAALAHFSFEKIHSFLDGNGRVGRLLIHLTLKKWHYDLRGLVAFEEYFDTHRQSYYDLLNLNPKDTTEFIVFFLKSLKFGLKRAIKIISLPQALTKEDLLPPRRYEILQIIKDHRQVSFDFLQRRFLTVSGRLLRYDLKKLQDTGFIRKRGVTKGAAYEPK